MSEVASAAPAASPSVSLTPAQAANMPSQTPSLENNESHESVEAVEADPTLTKAEKVIEKKRIKSLKLKYNGKEYNEDLPFEIDDTPEAIEYMTKQLQLGKMGQSKAQEYSQLEKEVKSFIEELRKNPKKVLNDPTIGIDIKQLAASIIEEEIENSQKSPEQLEKEKLQAELKAMKDEQEKEKEERKTRDFERLQQQEFERYDMQMTQALDKHPDLPKSPYIVKKMADYMLMGLNQGIDVTAEDVIPLVKQELQDDLREMFAVMPEDVIEAIVGKDVISKLRKKSVAKGRAGVVPGKVADTGAPKADKDGKKEVKEKMDFKTFFGNL